MTDHINPGLVEGPNHSLGEGLTGEHPSYYEREAARLAAENQRLKFHLARCRGALEAAGIPEPQEV